MPSENKQEWTESTLDPVLKRFGERQDAFETASGISEDVLYTPEDRDGAEYADQLGYPGEFPYTRGVQPTMYRGRLWTMRQYAGLASPEESNRRYHYLIEHGQTGLSVAFDLPTQTGYDSDHAMAQGEIGRTGVPISSLADMETLFDGIPLDRVSTSMTINATAPILLALYIAVAKEQGVDPVVLNGTIQNDILKEYIARGTYIYPPKPSMRLVTDTFEYCSEHVPRWNTISISGYHMAEAGATAAQEVAFTFSNAIAYVQAAVDAGLDVDRFAPRLSFFFVAQSHLFEEIAKFRAARRCGPRSCASVSGGEPSLLDMPIPHPDRGCHPYCPAARQQHYPYDDSGPCSHPRRHTIAPRQLEGRGTRSAHRGVCAALATYPADPCVRDGRRQHCRSIGGLLLRREPDRRGRRAGVRVHPADRRSGRRAFSTRQGLSDQEIHESAFSHQQKVEDGERVVVGVNRFQAPTPPIERLQTIGRLEAQKQLDRLAQVRRERDDADVKAALRASRTLREDRECHARDHRGRGGIRHSGRKSQTSSGPSLGSNKSSRRFRQYYPL